MPFFHAKTPLDKAFAVGLFLKALDGFFESLSGVAVLFIKRQWVLDAAHGLVGYHPHNVIGTYLLKSAEDFGKGTALFAALYLLSHGLVKLVLVVEIVREHLWAYPGLIVVTAGFILYQLYHLFFVHVTFSFIGLTVFDVIIIWLTWREYGHQKVRLSKKYADEAST